MNAVSFIKKHADGLKLLEYYDFEHIHDNGTEIRSACKIHGGDNPQGFVWNKQNGLWYCFTGDCGGGDCIDLIMKIEDLGFKDAVLKAAKIFELNINGMDIVVEEDRIAKEQKKFLQKNKLKERTEEVKLIIPDIKKYTEWEDFKRFNVSCIAFFCAYFVKIFPLDESMLYNKLVIPVSENKKVRFLALRSLDESLPKWRFYPKGTKVGNYLYNMDNIDENFEKIILVEGIFDVWAYHNAGIDNCMAIFGSHLKENQLKKLLQLSCDIVLSFDNDESGNKCKKECIEKLKNYCTLYEVNLPEGKDPADIHPTLLRQLYEERKKIN